MINKLKIIYTISHNCLQFTVYLMLMGGLGGGKLSRLDNVMGEQIH